MTQVDLVEAARWKWRGGRTRHLVAENSERGDPGNLRRLVRLQISRRRP